jgi:branched-chain amino acid transport system substrate-binding protein
LITIAGSSDLTGKSCSANLARWSWDSWCLAHSTATSLVRTGGSKWFFLTADYAFGHAAEAKFVKAAGGSVLGSVRYPFGPTLDFSSFLLQARSSGANVIAFANSGNEPAESASTGDVCKLVSTLSATESFRPLEEGGCALVRS